MCVTYTGSHNRWKVFRLIIPVTNSSQISMEPKFFPALSHDCPRTLPTENCFLQKTADNRVFLLSNAGIRSDTTVAKKKPQLVAVFLHRVFENSTLWVWRNCGITLNSRSFCDAAIQFLLVYTYKRRIMIGEKLFEIYIWRAFTVNI